MFFKFNKLKLGNYLVWHFFFFRVCFILPFQFHYCLQIEFNFVCLGQLWHLKVISHPKIFHFINLQIYCVLPDFQKTKNTLCFYFFLILLPFFSFNFQPLLVFSKVSFTCQPCQRVFLCECKNQSFVRFFMTSCQHIHSILSSASVAVTLIYILGWLILYIQLFCHLKSSIIF